MHPTVKPVSLVADALRDCSTRGGVVLDAFGGSGTTLIAAERLGRRAALLEIDPAYVDVTIRRWQRMTGKDAIRAETGETFDEIAARQPAQLTGPRRDETPQLSGPTPEKGEHDEAAEAWLKLIGERP